MRTLTSVNSPENAPELLMNDTRAYMMIDADSAEGTTRTADTAVPTRDRGHPVATRYAMQSASRM